VRRISSQRQPGAGAEAVVSAALYAVLTVAALENLGVITDGLRRTDESSPSASA